MAKKLRIYDVRLQVSNPLGKMTYKVLVIGTNSRIAKEMYVDALKKDLQRNEIPKFNINVSSCSPIKNDAIMFEKIQKNV